MESNNVYTFDGERMIVGYHYRIYKNGVVQPFGALFYGKRGDIKRLVVEAVKRLNYAHDQGWNDVRINGSQDCFKWSLITDRPIW